GGMKNGTTYGVLAPKSLFKQFIMMWLGILALMTLIAMLVTPAKADVLLPITPMVKISSSAVISPFTKQASPALVEKNCQSLLAPTNETVQINTTNNASRNRRNAGSGERTVINAIKAYRKCAKSVALEELARN
ncbi:MAG: hypothetical protein KDJ26_07675, partial [Alphaproteobacteria bacterium]|nr:hypothetical protein [Alphaproteobacteria bacterium]